VESWKAGGLLAGLFGGESEESMMQSPVGVGPPNAQAEGQPQQWVMMQQTGMQPQHHEEVKTLWVGDLQYWMDENYLHTAFVHTGEVRSPCALVWAVGGRL
jgi:hypothetical protein